MTGGEGDAPARVTDFDPDLWIEVPVVFPFAEWPDAPHWAEDIAAEAALRPDDREAIAARARALADSDWPATRRFWYFPVAGGYEAIVHVIDVDEVIPDDRVIAMLSEDEARITDPVIERIEGQPSAWRSAFVVSLGPDGSPGGDAHRGDGEPGRAMGVLRAVRVREEGTTLVELVDVDLAAIGAVLPDFDALVGDLDFVGGGVANGRR